jgi:hypothetical protein
MKVHKRIARGVLLTSLILLPVWILAQEREGDRTMKIVEQADFEVDVPVPLQKDRTAFSGFTLFGAKNDKFVFLVYVYDAKAQGASDSSDKLLGLEYVLGGDDDADFSQEDVTIDGLPARKIVYRHQNNAGLLIDAGDKVFILGLAVKNRKDLNSVIANRFFASFKLNVVKKNG